MPRSRHPIVLDEFYCTICGTKGIPIARCKGSEREAGHLKKLYCLKCKKETNHVECKPFSRYTYEHFLEEYNFGNFDENGSRIHPYGEMREMIYNGKK